MMSLTPEAVNECFCLVHREAQDSLLFPLQIVKLIRMKEMEAKVEMVVTEMEVRVEMEAMEMVMILGQMVVMDKMDLTIPVALDILLILSFHLLVY
jgi:hypothetical protein